MAEETKQITEEVKTEAPVATVAQASEKPASQSSTTLQEVKKEVEKLKEKISKSDKKAEVKPELEREYVINLRHGVIRAQKYRRAKKAIRVLKEFLAKHMKVENRDLRNIKLDRYLNNEIWFRGIRKPLMKVKVKAIKKEGVVYAELAEIPEHVKWVMARDKKRVEKVGKVKAGKAEEKEEKTAEQKEKESKDAVRIHAEEKEKEKATVEAGMKEQKIEAKQAKHETKPGKQKTTPRRQVLQR